MARQVPPQLNPLHCVFKIHFKKNNFSRKTEKNCRLIIFQYLGSNFFLQLLEREWVAKNKKIYLIFFLMLILSMKCKW